MADKVLVPQAKNISACHLFSLFQNESNPQEFLLYELWENERAIIDYKQKLISILGETDPGEEFPAVMNKLIMEDEDLV